MIQLVLEQKNPEVCGRGGCPTKIALSINNPELYEKVDRDRCFEEFGKRTKNIDFCRKVKNRYIQADCIIDIAVSKSDKTLCNLIEVDYEQERCFEKFK